MSTETTTPEETNSIITKLINARKAERATEEETEAAKKTLKRFAWVGIATVAAVAITITIANSFGNDEESTSDEDESTED